MKSLNYIDLFAGAGGLSEGFIRAGFEPIAHVEYDKAACYTLQTRIAFHYLKENGKEKIYYSYLKGKISRKELYASVPSEVLESVINAKIGDDNSKIFSRIDKFINERPIDLIIGGPPCQAYSYIGRAALKHRETDERTTLYIHYGRFLKRYNPKMFVFENVPGILTAGKGKYFANLKKYYKALGYTVEAKLYDSHEYEVVQHRRRLIIVGWKKDLDLEYPEIEKSVSKYYRDDIFSDLPKIKPGENNRFHNYKSPTNDYLKTNSIRNGINFVTQHIARPHNERDLHIYGLAIAEMEIGNRLKNNQIPLEKRTQKNVTDFLDRFKVVDIEPHTMIAHIAKDGHHFIHPDKQQLRSISVREAARIQSFPDDYFFEGIKENQYRTAAFKQIGNAVPPILANTIAVKIKSILK
jgi:DNA (cytosine-5)-methyltransferase 1